MGVEGVEAIEDGLGEGDAFVGVGVVGGEVDGFGLGAAGFFECGGESIGGRGVAVVGGDDEDGSGGEFGGEGGDVPVGGVGEELFGEIGGAGGWGAAVEGGEAVGVEGCGDFGEGGLLLMGLDDGERAASHVGGGDEVYGADFGVAGGYVGGDHASHGVADEDDGFGIGAELLCVDGVAEPGEGSFGVLDAVGEGEGARSAPGAAVVEVEYVPTGASDGLGEVEVPLVAGEAVEEDDGGVRAGAFGGVHEGIEESAVAGELEGFECGGGGFIGDGVRGEGGLGLSGEG